MSFNWPEIPFTGAEVEAFVAAYKELAESIYANWDGEALAAYQDYPGYAGSQLKEPFTNKETVKKLMESGLLYAAFIIKQRSGGGGPGTDFILGNSPYSDTISEQEKIQLIRDLGCVFNPSDMQNAWKENNPDKPIPPRLDDEIDSLGDPNGDDINPNGRTIDDNPHQDENCPNLTPKEQFLLGLAGGIGSNLLGVKTALTRRYLSCNKSPFTEDDMNADTKNELENKINQFLENAPDRECNLLGCIDLKTDITNSLSEEQKSKYGAGPEDKVYQLCFYGSWGGNLGLSNLFGCAVGVVGGDNTIKSIRDDFDFEYGNTVDRSDGSVAGDPYDNSKNGIYYEPHQKDKFGNPVPIGSPDAASPTIYPAATEDDVISENTSWWDGTQVGRTVVASSHKDGRGTPVPVNIRFN